jgi:Glycosyl hydrolase family 3 C-terminal domain/Fibronectin type III-like domain
VRPQITTRRRAASWASALVAATVVTSSLLAVAEAATTDPNPSPREIAHAALSRRVATEGMVLLENRGALPIAASGSIALFGVGAYATVKGGTGSGDVNNRYTISVLQGLEQAGYGVTTQPAYWDAMVAAYTAAGPGHYAEGEVALTDATARPTAATTTALYVLARNSGEGKDRTATKGDYYLNDTERANLEVLGRTYANVVVVLNVGGVVDTSFFRDINQAETDAAGGTALDGLLLMSQPGQEAGRALVDVLDGAVTPSGKTSDTWASSYSYYPAAPTISYNDGKFTPEPYSEGVYVGYRYFDSFYKKINTADPAGVVNYPFGYGLSYTRFRIDTQTETATARTVSVQAKVTNTGSRRGKEVVEVYFSAPQTGLDKPYQELAAYAKTDELTPGASQRLTVSFPTSQMSSFDTARSAYLLDAGEYAIRVGNSSRNTHIVAEVAVNGTAITQRVNHELNDQAPAPELHSSADAFYSYPQQARELARAPQIRVNARSVRTQDARSDLEQSVSVPLSSAYHPLDGDTLSTTTAYTLGESDWNRTGGPYAPKLGETVRRVSPAPSGTTLFDVALGRVSLQRFVAGLTVDQLANIVEGGTGLPAGAVPSTSAPVGSAGSTTARYENLGIPSASLVDGPAGVRITQSYETSGQTYYQYATAWPIGRPGTAT